MHVTLTNTSNNHIGIVGAAAAAGYVLTFGHNYYVYVGRTWTTVNLGETHRNTKRLHYIVLRHYKNNF